MKVESNMNLHPQNSYMSQKVGCLKNALHLFHLGSKEEKSVYKNYLNILDSRNPHYRPELFDINSNISENLKYFLFEVNDIPKILMPFYLRPIKLDNKETAYSDVISPYGYNGPLLSKDATIEDVSLFWNAVDTFYKENNIVAEFLRFSLAGNYYGYTGSLIQTLSNVRGIINSNELEQWQGFKPKVRNNYRKAKDNNLKCIIYSGLIEDANVTEFYTIYVNTMQRKMATDDYRYDYKNLLNFVRTNIPFRAIAIVYKDDVPVSAELILLSKDTMYSFLGGTEAEYFDYRPNDFLKVEVINWGRKNNYSYYVLGGGRRDGDSLYSYKKSFFHTHHDVYYYTGRKIVDIEVYNSLVSAAGTLEQEAYFPLYRYTRE